MVGPDILPTNYAKVGLINTDQGVERKTGKTVPTGQMTGLHWMKSGFPELKLSEVKSIRRE
jgi:hypothetical protein